MAAVPLAEAAVRASRWCGQPGSNRHSACAPRDF